MNRRFLRRGEAAWGAVCLRLCALLWLALGAGQAGAHAPEQSYVMLSILENSIEGRVEIPVSDVNRALGLSLKTYGSVTESDLEPYLPRIDSYVADKVRLAPEGSPAALEITGHRLFNVSFAQYVIVEFGLPEVSEIPQSVDVEYGIIADLDPDHRSMLVIENNWRTSTFNQEANVILTFTPDDYRQTLDLSSLSLWRGFLGMVEIGTHHIAIGLDHILFIIALLLPSVMYRDDRRWQPVPGFKAAFFNVVKIVTLFTIAHSITLSLATLGLVQVPSRLVESIIALSIILVALDIVIPVFRQRIWWVVFLFGLFHGFGFASVLADMGIDAGFTGLTLLGFNLGVEVGQLVIVFIAFPLLYLLRGAKLYSRVGMPYGATALLIVASYWFIERAFNVDLPAGAILNQVIGVFA